MAMLEETDCTFVLMIQPRLRSFYSPQLSSLISLPLSLLPINPVASQEENVTGYGLNTWVKITADEEFDF